MALAKGKFRFSFDQRIENFAGIRIEIGFRPYFHRKSLNSEAPCCPGQESSTVKISRIHIFTLKMREISQQGKTRSNQW